MKKLTLLLTINFGFLVLLSSCKKEDPSPKVIESIIDVSTYDTIYPNEYLCANVGSTYQYSEEGNVLECEWVPFTLYKVIRDGNRRNVFKNTVILMKLGKKYIHGDFYVKNSETEEGKVKSTIFNREIMGHEGTSWFHQVDNSNSYFWTKITYEEVDHLEEFVTLSGEEFEDVIVIRSHCFTGSDKSAYETEEYKYYAKGVGLVRSIYHDSESWYEFDTTDVYDYTIVPF
ncbi:MAG: hypothetical protein MI810_16600 [Flavobacteriales bacterium]|nr:hypothetical protein [Flavobacteriales bacterium]